MNMQKADAAYFAGFIDADGYITIDRSKRQLQHHRQNFYYVPRMGVCNRNYDLLQWFDSLTNSTGSFRKRSLSTKNKNWSDCWWLGWTSNPMRKILPIILPYLRIKKRQAELVFEMLALKQGTLDLRTVNTHQQFKLMSKDYENKTERYEEIFRLVRSYNKRGPEYLANNGVNSGNPKSKDKATLSQAGDTSSEGAETTGAVKSA